MTDKALCSPQYIFFFKDSAFQPVAIIFEQGRNNPNLMYPTTLWRNGKKLPSSIADIVELIPTYYEDVQYSPLKKNRAGITRRRLLWCLTGRLGSQSYSPGRYDLEMSKELGEKR